MATTKTIALATSNKGKLEEVNRYLQGVKIELYRGPKLTSPVEDGTNYLANAAIKARHGAKGWNVPCVGEDSGIEVNGLNDLPGPFSARFCSFLESDIRKAVACGSLAIPFGFGRVLWVNFLA